MAKITFFYISFKGLSNKKKLPNMADFLAKKEFKVQNDTSIVLICLYKVWNHFKLFLFKTQLHETTSSREMKSKWISSFSVKTLWYCVGGRVKQKFGYVKRVDKG